MCWLTARTFAATVLNVEHVKLEQTLNDRTLPVTGGVTRTGAKVRGDGAAGGGTGTPYARVRPMPRNTPSKAAATGDWPGSRPPGSATVAAAAATVVVAPRS